MTNQILGTGHATSHTQLALWQGMPRELISMRFSGDSARSVPAGALLKANNAANANQRRDALLVRWQGHERQDQALCQSCRPGLEIGRRRTANQPIGTGSVLQTHMLAHGQTQGNHCGGPQARASYLYDAHQGCSITAKAATRGVHRSMPGLLRRTLPRTVLWQLSQRAKKLGMKLVVTEQPQPA